MGVLADYPRTRAEFDEMFATEQDCAAYLARLRWPSSFKCQSCGNEGWWLTSRLYACCTKCQRQQSLKSGTMLQGSRFPLKTWFQVAWNTCEQKNGISALGLQRAVGFGSYHTAWEWLHRMRQAMVQPGRNKLNGEVEVDEAFIGGVKAGKRGRGAAGKTLIMVAVEVRGTVIGRIRLLVIPDAKTDTLIESVQLLVEPASDVVTDGLAGYSSITDVGYNHTVSRYTPEVGKNLLPKAHRVISLLKRWLLGTHQGAVSNDRLQPYLDEFVFRFNRRTSASRGLLFYRLMQQAVQHRPITKAAILANPIGC